MAEPLWLVGLELLAVLVLVGLNAFFVAAEFALVKARRSAVAARAKAGEARAKAAQELTNRLDAYLSACQLGITMASIGLGWIGEPAIASLLEPAFRSAGVPEWALHTAAFAIAFGLITMLHIVFGEQAPKMLAIHRPVPTALLLARPLRLFYRMFRPAIAGLNGLSNAVVRAAGVDPSVVGEAAHTETELREIIADTTTQARGRSAQRTRLLLNLLDLSGLKVGDIMTPVNRIVFLDARKPLDENIRLADDSGFSRFPLMDGSPDHIVGMVHYKDIFSRVIRKDRPEQTLLDIKRDVLTVPESQPAEALLTEFLTKGKHMAIIVDEFGRTIGLLTMEDLFEEVFGSIRDEFDEPEQPYKVLREGVYLVDGTTSLHDLEPLIGRSLKKPGVTTVSGFVIDAMGRIPQGGEALKVDGWEMCVREVGRRRVKSVELRRPSAAPDLQGPIPQIQVGDMGSPNAPLRREE